jgi:hypothetical protein
MVAFKREFLIQCECIMIRCHARHSTDPLVAPRDRGSTHSHVMAVPASQHSQHFGERAITQVDYDGAQAVRSENYRRPRRRTLSRSRSRHRRSSRHSNSSKAPEIFIQRKHRTAYLTAFCFYSSDSAVDHEWGRGAHEISFPRPSSCPSSSPS